MLADHFTAARRTRRRTGRRSAYTFVPGNLTELLGVFDILPVYPEINALQSAMRQKSAGYIREAERLGHNEDVCTYVKCDIGMMTQGNIGPTGEQLPPPDLLLLSVHRLLHLHEVVRAPAGGVRLRDRDAARAVRRRRADADAGDAAVRRRAAQGRGHPQDGEGHREEVRPRRAAGAAQALGAGPRTTWSGCWRAPRSARRPSTPTSAASTTSAPSSPPSAAPRTASTTTGSCAPRCRSASTRGEGPVTPDGTLAKEKYRLVVEGPPNWTHFRDFWRIFYDEGAVFVASTYTKVGGLYDRGFRHDQEKDPLLVARRLLPRLLHEPLAAAARRPDRATTSASTRPTASSSTRSRAATRSPPGSW